jgi:hypothetical protein
MLGLAFEVVQSASVDAVNLAMYSKISNLRSQRHETRCKWRRPHRVDRSQDCRAFAGQRSAHKTVEFQKQPDQFGTKFALLVSKISRLSRHRLISTRSDANYRKPKSKG